MKVIEFQIPLPLTLEMYERCCVYLVTKASMKEVESGGGFEISRNEMCEQDGVLGRLMEKRFYFGKSLPSWLQSLLGRELTIVSEHSWTVFPYTITSYSNKKLTFEFCFESITNEGLEPQENALNLNDKDLSRRKVIVLDITEFKKCKLYDSQFDVTVKESQHTDALPMKPGWWKQPGSVGVIAHKVLKVDIPYFGFLSSRVENYLVNYLQDKLMLYVCTAMCSIDEWYNADIKYLRMKEQECYDVLNQNFREQYGHIFRDSQELPAQDTPKASSSSSFEEKQREVKSPSVAETAVKPQEVEKSSPEAPARLPTAATPVRIPAAAVPDRVPVQVPAAAAHVHVPAPARVPVSATTTTTTSPARVPVSATATSPARVHVPATVPAAVPAPARARATVSATATSPARVHVPAPAPAESADVVRQQVSVPSSKANDAAVPQESTDPRGYRSVLSAAFSDIRRDTQDGAVGGAYVSRAVRVVTAKSFRSVTGEEEFWDCMEELEDANSTMGSVPSRRPSLSTAYTSSSAVRAVYALKHEDEYVSSSTGPASSGIRKSGSMEEHGYRHVHEDRASQFHIEAEDVLPIPDDHSAIIEYKVPGSSIDNEESEPMDTERGDHSSSSLGDVDDTVAPLAAAAERYTPSMFTGYLYKLGGTFFYQWNIRYIMICDGNMHYYDSRDDTRPKATISLMDARINWVGHYMGRPNVFSVTTRAKRTYYWSAEEESTVKRWILLLQVLSESSPEALMDDLATEYLYRVEKAESVGECSPPSAGSYMDTA